MIWDWIWTKEKSTIWLSGAASKTPGPSVVFKQLNMKDIEKIYLMAR